MFICKKKSNNFVNTDRWFTYATAKMVLGLRIEPLDPLLSYLSHKENSAAGVFDKAALKASTRKICLLFSFIIPHVTTLR